MWLTFVRETEHNADPALPLISPSNVTWHTALIITSKGYKVTIAGRYEVENFKRMGVWDEVISYDQSIQPALVEVLVREDFITLFHAGKKYLQYQVLQDLSTLELAKMNAFCRENVKGEIVES